MTGCMGGREWWVGSCGANPQVMRCDAMCPAAGAVGSVCEERCEYVNLGCKYAPHVWISTHRHS